MAILITGGAGLLGSTLVRQLLEKGTERPVVLDIAPTPDRLSEVLDRIEYIPGDLGDPGTVESAVKRVRPDVIFHLGAMLGLLCDNDPGGAMRVNVQGTFAVLDAARRYEVPKVVFASSVTTFGLDMPERVIRDDTVQRPLSFYGITKVFGEGAGLFFKRKYGLDFRSVRLPSIVGPGVREGGLINFTSAMIEQCYCGNPCTVNVTPETRIPVLHTDDAARAMLNLAEAPLERVRTVNYLVDGVKPTPSAGEMAEMVRAKIPGAQIDFQPLKEWQPLVDMLAVPIDDRRAGQEWGWQPSLDYRGIIDDFVFHLKRS